jgi:hypothetical protein
MPRKGAKYQWMLEDADVRRWLLNIERGSPLTAEVSLRRLGKACELLKLTPKDMILRAKENLKAFQDSLEDLVSQLEKEKKAPQYIAGILKNIRSWLRYNDIILTRKIKISNYSATPIIGNEQVPSQEELARIFRNSSSKVRAAEALIAFADLRPETIGNYNGSDGLKLSDLPELKIADGEVSFEKIPTMIIVRASLSKARHKYFTFLSSEGCEYLKEYLEERLREGEKLTPESPLIAHDRIDDSSKEFLTTRSVSKMIRNAMRKAGVYKRPYVLRAYCETQLIIAESEGKISHPYLQFIAGHKGDIEATYSTNKGRLPPQMIEDMREQYRQCEEFLNTRQQTMSQDAILATFNKQFLKLAGYSDEEIDKLGDLSKLSAEEIQQLIKQKSMQALGLNGNHQKVVPMNEVRNYIMQGWEYVTTLPTNEAIIRLPAH